MNISYDFIIVGGGPSGLTLAWLLSHGLEEKKKVLVIEREESLGGCHRVRRVNGLFTEHGPRIYSDAYLNMIQILEEMGINFHKVFTDYKFGSGKISSNLMSQMSIREIFYLVLAFVKLLINPNWGQKISVLEYSTYNNFSEKTIDELDRLCRLTDGAGADKYTMWELLSSFDQHIMYKFYQPRRPNDVYLFPMWKDKLEQTGQVKFLMNTEVRRLILDKNGQNKIKIRGVNVITSGGHQDILGKEVVLAIPPDNISKLVSQWGNYDLSKFAKESRYITYIPVTFHWDKKLKLPPIWGFPSTPWGILSLLSSDYTTFDDPRSETLLSCCASITDVKSPKTGKTANETIDKNELIAEIFRQISEVYGGLPKPTVSVLSPGVYRQNSQWRTFDSAFVLTPQGGYLPEFSHPNIKGLHMIGTQNGKSYYHFTAMESAVTNTIGFFLERFPEMRRKYHIRKPMNLSKILRFLIVFLIIGGSIILFLWK